MNSTIETLLKHRTIREFTDEPVSDEVVHKLFDVALHTATSMGMQNTSIIWVKDPDKRRILADINGQEYVARAPVYMLFIVDLHRASRVFAEDHLSDSGVRTMDLFMAAFTDACLQVQNVVAAAESLGLGTTILGGVLNDPARVIRTLNLPELTFPVLGLMLGHPNQDPQMKPRIDKNLRVMVDEYRDQENWHEALADYDQALQTYYDLRNAHKPVQAYTKLLEQHYGSPHPSRARILSDIAAQGFDVSIHE